MKGKDTMKNWCSINLFIRCKNKKEAVRLEQDLFYESVSDQKDNVIFTNSGQSLKFAELDRDDSLVTIHGDTVGVPEHKSILEWQKSLSGFDIEDIQIEYHSMENKVFGKYRIDSENLIDIRLPEENYPEIPEAWYGLYFDIMSQELEKYGEEKIIAA